MQDIPLLWNQTGKKASDEDELRTEENRFLVQCNKKKRADTGKRKASITCKADRKEIYFYLALQHGKIKQHMILQCIFLEKQHERKN